MAHKNATNEIAACTTRVDLAIELDLGMSRSNDCKSVGSNSINSNLNSNLKVKSYKMISFNLTLQFIYDLYK